MTTHLAGYAAHLDPGWADGTGPWAGGGPGWWLVFPIALWALVLALVGYLLYQRTPRRSARTAAERTLADRYARGEIDEDELRRRRAALRSRH